MEDNLVNQRVLQKQLKNLGCVVHVANHGGEALDILRKSTWWNHVAGSNTKESERISLSVVLMDQEMVSPADHVYVYHGHANTPKACHGRFDVHKEDTGNGEGGQLLSTCTSHCCHGKRKERTDTDGAGCWHGKRLRCFSID